jgi:peptide chain release factor 2
LLEFDELKLGLIKLLPSIENLADAIALPKLKTELKELEEMTLSQEFWEDMQSAQEVSRKISGIKSTIDGYENLMKAYEDISTMIEIAIEENDDSLFDEINTSFKQLNHEIETQTLATLLTGEYDKNNAILTFHAGAGGTEAQDWVQMIYRMYTRYCERSGFKYKVLDHLDGDEAGIKSISILIEGLNAYGFLKSEAGVHRLVRISPFDSSGRRHTSFASLEVTPEIIDDGAIAINNEDLKVDTYRASGAGGQHVNKTDSAVRITHIPTGIVVASQNQRSQHQNRDFCMKMLISKLAEIKEREHLDKIEDIKGTQKEIGWGSQIRSYVFMPYTLAKDHRTGFEVGNISAVMDGDLDGFINAYLKMNSKKELNSSN